MGEEMEHDAEYYNELGIQQYNHEEYEKAVESFEEATELAADIAEFWYNLGNAQYRMGKYVDSSKSFTKAVELDSGNSEYWIELGDSQYMLLRYEESKKAYEEITKLVPDNAKHWNRLGSAQYGLGEFGEAIKSYEKATELASDIAVYWKELGDAQYNLGEYKEATKSYEEAIILESDTATYWNDLGAAQDSLGECKEAAKSYEKAMKLAPDNAVYWNNLGYVQYRIGKYEESIKSYDKAMKLAPDKAVYWNNLGYLQFIQNHFEESIRLFEKTIELDKMADGETYLLLGEAYNHLDDSDKALEKWIEGFDITSRKDDKRNLAKKIYQQVIKNCEVTMYGRSFEVMGYLLSSTSFFPPNVDSVEKENDEIDRQIDTLTNDEIIKTTKESGFIEYNKYLSDVLSDIDKIETNEEDTSKKKYMKSVFNFLKSVNRFKENRYEAAKNEVGGREKGKNKPFFQYTSTDVLKIFLGLNDGEDNKKKKINLRLNNTNYMNDPTEGSYFLRDVLSYTDKNETKTVTEKGEAKASELARDLTYNNESHAFIASLTLTKKDDIPMWKMYGRDSEGVAIGLEIPKDLFDQNGKDDNSFSNKSLGNRVEIKQNNLEINSSNRDYLDEKSLLYKIYYYDKDVDSNTDEEKLINKIRTEYYELMSLYMELEKEERQNNLKRFIEWEFDRIKFLIKDIQYQYEDEYRILRLTKDYEETKHDKGDPRLYTEVEGVKIREVIFGAKSDNASYWTPVIHKILGDDVEVRDSDTSIKF